jgi:O-antigen/teichoic acid export membrane protein
MGAGVAAVNVCTGLAHFFAWRRKAGHIRLRPFPVDFAELRRMVGYCVILTVWSMCMLVISGLDLTIVGHYAFTDAAFYSVAAAPTTIMLLVVGALMGPLLPAASALSATRTPEQMGNVLLRSTRLATTLYWVVALPLLLGGYIFLYLWVGTKYATAAIPMLRVLLLANLVRQLCGPYAAMVIATSRQRVATAAAIGEGVVNLTASILLAKRFGGVGVAAGTLIGAAASVSMHFGISMHYTRNLAISRGRLFLLGILKPATIAIPSIVLLRFWWVAGMPRMTWPMWAAWAVSTPLLAYWVALSTEDRTVLRSRLGLA